MDEKVFVQVVLAQHDCNDGTMRGQEYAFLVPFGMKLKKGELVKVETRRGEKLAKCTTDSLEVTEETLIMLQRVALGEHKKFTGKVLGKYEFVEPEDPEDNTFEDEDELDEEEDDKALFEYLKELYGERGDEVTYTFSFKHTGENK